MSDEGRFTAARSGWYRFEAGREPEYLGDEPAAAGEVEAPPEVRRWHLKPPRPPWQMPEA